MSPRSMNTRTRLSLSTILLVLALMLPLSMAKSELPPMHVEPVVHPATHPAREWKGQGVKTADQLLEQACPKQHARSRKVVRSAFDDLGERNITVSASENGLVYGIFHAYADHHHLTIRPEDVWFAILTQLSYYINANAEELRSKFVAHEGQKEVKVTAVGTIDTVDIGGLAVALTEEMHKHLIDAELRDWIMPGFTTTTRTDTITAAVLMMGTMQKYFSYMMELTCGIPSVTLLGRREDWADIRRRLDKLADFGEESKLFGRLLKPILDNFIRTFDDPTDEKVVDFWRKVCHHEANMSGPDYLSGWVTAFCFWDENGKTMMPDRREPLPAYGSEETFDSEIYPWVKMRDIPAGIVSVPVTVDDNGRIYNTTMVAGSVGLQWTSSGRPLDVSNKHDDPTRGQLINGEFIHDVVDVELSEDLGLDTIQPATGWWMYWQKDEEQLKKIEKQENEYDDFGWEHEEL